MTFGSTGIIFKIYNISVSEAFWGQPYLHAAVSGYHPWIFAVLGSTITGWSVCFLFLALYPFIFLKYRTIAAKQSLGGYTT